MQSMTGFGRAAGEIGGWEVAVEVAGVNRKGLEITVALPRDWSALERPLAEAARVAVQRGKVHLAVEARRTPAPTAVVATDDAAAVTAPTFDHAAAARLLDEMAAFARSRGLAFTPDAGTLWRLAESCRLTTALPGASEVREAVEALGQRALADFVAMRAAEGAALQRDLTARLALLGRCRETLAALAPTVVPNYREALLARLRQAGLTELRLDDDRVLREIALFADRCDVAEELTRLASHLEQFAETLRSTEAVGRKLEFLVQEIHREFNTIGSKANLLPMTKVVLEAKNELERLKEQLANIE